MITMEELYGKLEKEYGEIYWVENHYDKLNRYTISIESNHFEIAIPENIKNINQIMIKTFNDFISFYEINRIMTFINKNLK